MIRFLAVPALWRPPELRDRSAVPGCLDLKLRLLAVLSRRQLQTGCVRCLAGMLLDWYGSHTCNSTPHSDDPMGGPGVTPGLYGQCAVVSTNERSLRRVKSFFIRWLLPSQACMLDQTQSLWVAPAGYLDCHNAIDPHSLLCIVNCPNSHRTIATLSVPLLNDTLL